MSIEAYMPKVGETVIEEQFTGPIQILKEILLEQPAVQTPTRVPVVTSSGSSDKRLITLDGWTQLSIPRHASTLSVSLVGSSEDPGLIASGNVSGRDIPLSPLNIIGPGFQELFINSLIPESVHKEGPFVVGDALTLFSASLVTLSLIWR